MAAQQRLVAQENENEEVHEDSEEASQQTTDTRVEAIQTLIPLPSSANGTSSLAPPRPTFRLLALPQEIQDITYRYMIHDGRVNILQTCSEVYRAASQFIHPEAVLRIQPRSERHARPIRKFSSPSQLLAMVQHIEFKLCTTGVQICNNPEYLMLHHLIRSRTPRQTCSIILETIKSDATAICLRPLWYFSIASTFEILTVLSVLRLSRSDNSCPLLLTPQDLPFQTGMYRQFRDMLEPTLGPSIWQVNYVQNLPYLAFYPRSHEASWAKGKKKGRCVHA